MKMFISLALVLILCSCAKDTTVTEVRPDAISDSANLIYTFSSPPNSFMAMAAYTIKGEKKWEAFGLESYPAIRSTYAAGNLYVTGGRKVKCWDAESGVLKWTVVDGSVPFYGLQ